MVSEATIMDTENNVIINHINNDSCNIYIKCKINNKYLMAMIDTGSVKNCMSYRFYRTISGNTVLNPIHQGIKFMTATGSPIFLYGNLEIIIEINGNKCPIEKRSVISKNI